MSPALTNNRVFTRGGVQLATQLVTTLWPLLEAIPIQQALDSLISVVHHLSNPVSTTNSAWPSGAFISSPPYRFSSPPCKQGILDWVTLSEASPVITPPWKCCPDLGNMYPSLERSDCHIWLCHHQIENPPVVTDPVG